MFVRGGRVVHSASDLKAAVECEWAMLRRLDAKLGRVEAVPDPVDAMERRAKRLGNEHEERKLADYRERFGPYRPGRGGGVAAIERPADPTGFHALEAAQAATLVAIADGADVVYQGTFFDGAFLGFADFLMRHAGVWEVYDTKLARTARVPALLQVAAYSKQLAALGVPVGPHAHLVLGDGTTSTHAVADVLPVFERLQARLLELVAARLADSQPIGWDAAGVRRDGRCAECAAQVEATRDVLLVARLTGRQRERLHAVGIRTIDGFAASRGPIEGIGPAALQRLRLQAQLQLRAERERRSEGTEVFAEVIDPEGLAALPAPDAGDVFFDFEGDPLWTDDDRVWGLEYLFGLVDEAGQDGYTPFWAHDRAGERQALLDFLHFVRDRRRAHPGMHVYHYADYERSHLQQLCARHGVGEAILDDLLRDHVLVDLYPVVTRTLRISERSYGLKRLEPLYMGDEPRRSEVTTGGDSIQFYLRYTELMREGSTTAAEQVLAEIADYNRTDCVSTLRLRDWLLVQADALRVRRRAPAPDEPPGDRRLARREDVAREALLAPVAGITRSLRTADEAALALAAAAIEYHRREDKSFWWEHFNREIAPVDDWADRRDVLVIEHAAVLEDWGRDGGRQVVHRRLRIRGELPAGSALKPGQAPFVLYDVPVSEPWADVPDGQRAEHDHTAVERITELRNGSVEIELDERASSGGPGWSALPVALTAPRPLPTRNQRQAILDWGEALAVRGVAAARDPATDLLRRIPPRLHGAGLAPVAGGDTVTAVVDSALRLDDSYLAVQGPPGTGKTHLGAQVIARLVGRGWRIGVVAQSHAVIENLLERVLVAGVEPGRVGKRSSPDRTTGGWTVLEGNDIPAFLVQGGGVVLGGTSWDVTHRGRVGARALDLLVVDEAGQYSLADTIAVAAAARNLLLLGDPQQLPQVSQGLHPEPVDESALGWLSGGHDVLPAHLGYFLAETWRMHPALTAAVSALSYDGRLAARTPTTTARSLEGIAPGLHPEPVEHAGDSVESEAEARAVVDLVRRTVGTRWTDPSADRFDEPLRPADLAVVAPYNAQVALIRTLLDAAHLRETPVGTVDKFQGKEAVVVIVSMTASSAADVPRGISFLLKRNRLNVAVSRAQWASHLVHSPALADYLPRTAVGLAELSGFLRLTGRDA